MAKTIKRPAISAAIAMERHLSKDPNVFVLDLGGGQMEYQPMGALNNRFRIHVQGKAWEHVSMDRLGRWVYRMVK